MVHFDSGSRNPLLCKPVKSGGARVAGNKSGGGGNAHLACTFTDLRMESCRSSVVPSPLPRQRHAG
jgi:hypothetical protein